MKSSFSTSWNSSVQPRKQRKYKYNAPLHTKGKFISAHLSKELAKKYNERTVRVRTGDKIKVMRGTHKGKEGRVERLDLSNLKVFVTKIENKKLDGSTVKYPLIASNLMIVALADDKRRFKDSSSSSLSSSSKESLSSNTKTTTKSESKASEKVDKKAVDKVVDKVVENKIENKIETKVEKEVTKPVKAVVNKEQV